MRLREFKKLRVGQRVYKYRGRTRAYGIITRLYNSFAAIRLKNIHCGDMMTYYKHIKHQKNESLK